MAVKKSDSEQEPWLPGNEAADFMRQTLSNGEP
jgi:hypothetical protein